MACSLTTRDQVSDAVIDALNVALERTDINEDTTRNDPQPDGLGLDRTAARLLLLPIKTKVESYGCDLDGVTALAVARQANVKHLVDLVSESLGIE